MSTSTWWVASPGFPREGERIHVRLGQADSDNGRIITVFRHRGKLSAIDAVCHHAGGPMTLGPVSDIEDLGVTVVSCPWHKFMVSIDGGVKVYQGVDILGGKPVPSGWKQGRIVQRPHRIRESAEGVFVEVNLSLYPDGADAGGDGGCVSDADACSPLCAQPFLGHFHSEHPRQIR